MSEVIDQSTTNESTVEIEPCEQIYRITNDPDEVARGQDTQARGALTIQDVTSAITCSSSVAEKLSLQLIEEMNKIAPNSLASFAHLNVDLLESVFPFLQPSAVAALERAINKRGKKLLVNSAYRTIAQQLILFNFGQRGECGIGLVARPGQSNHQSGLALDIEDHGGWKPFLEAEGWRWLGEKDPPHFDFVGGGTKDVRQTAILAFQILWDRHNPGDSINDGGSYGPQTEARLNRSPVDGFGSAASGKTVGTIARVLELQTPLMQGDDVLKVQQALIKAGFNLGENGTDKLYGMVTANAVKQFQQQKGLTADGKVGPKTREALGIT